MSTCNPSQPPLPRPWVSFGKLTAAVAATGLLSACSLFAQFNQMNQQDMVFRNDGVRVNVQTVGLALAMYARDHHGRYPSKTAWLAELGRGYYLPNKRLPANPWSLMDEHTQANIPATDKLPGMTDEGFVAPEPGLVLGKGERPASIRYQSTTFGAMLYDVSPNRRACVVYGIGQQDEQAIVVDLQVRGLK